MSDESPVFQVPTGEEYTDAAGTRRQGVRYVSFRYEAAENPSRSATAGRRVFDRVLIMRQHMPGTRDCLDRELLRYPEGSDEPGVSEPVLWDQVREFAEKWQANQKAAANGTPLALMNIGVDQIATLRTFGVLTVEMLADMPDVALKNFQDARALRTKAQAFVAAQRDGAPTAKLEAENASLRRELDEIREQLREMRAAARDDDEAPRRRGRPRKEAA